MPTELGLSEPVAIALVRRGYRTPEQARRFLEADESHDPDASSSSMDEVVERLLAAVEDGRRITVHGDFDVDGVCATTILVGALRELGARVRLADPRPARRRLRARARRTSSAGRARHRRLILTVDCGITAVERGRAGAASSGWR